MDRQESISHYMSPSYRSHFCGEVRGGNRFPIESLFRKAPQRDRISHNRGYSNQRHSGSERDLAKNTHTGLGRQVLRRVSGSWHILWGEMQH